MSAVEDLLGMQPFSLPEKEKGKIFLKAMRESLAFHYKNCDGYRKFCEKRGFNPKSGFSLEQIPFLHVDTFKAVSLLSVPEDEITKSVQSSSTTGSTPSTVLLDRVTIERQRKVLSSIMSSFIGRERKMFIVLDSPETVKAKDGRISSRASGIRGMLPFSKKFFFALDDGLHPDKDTLERAVSELNEGDAVCVFGFTFLIYQFIKQAGEDERLRKILGRLNNPLVVHTGGWKKLKDMRVEKSDFNKAVAAAFNTKPGRVIDMYGMTEQLGTVYPDCEYGYKHVPLYSDIIIRDPNSFEPVKNGEKGFIQLLSPVPNSYPGISLITDDMGVIVADDGCKCGRRGKAFMFSERAKKSEIKGCGDTFGL
jgi:phenylacetate-coenzyme A ligase PaaK-like adenylate-forming protein